MANKIYLYMFFLFSDINRFLNYHFNLCYDFILQLLLSYFMKIQIFFLFNHFPFNQNYND